MEKCIWKEIPESQSAQSAQLSPDGFGGSKVIAFRNVFSCQQGVTRDFR